MYTVAVLLPLYTKTYWTVYQDSVLTYGQAFLIVLVQENNCVSNEIRELLPVETTFGQSLRYSFVLTK